MTKLRKTTLSKNKGKSTWALTDDKTNAVIHTFRTKTIATKGGALKKQLGPEGGSVKIKKENNKIQEERTFPRSKDPKSSKG
jgi:hypothetical protein